ncbi:hypothetical protein H8959_000973 [Pygathrix nigripes]
MHSQGAAVVSLRGCPARDLLLSLVVPAPSQPRCRSHPEDTTKAFCRRELELKEAAQLVPNDMGVKDVQNKLKWRIWSETQYLLTAYAK